MNKYLLNTLLLLFFTGLSLLGAELVLRGLGFRPEKVRIHKNEPTMHEFNATLGWNNKPGQYTFEPYAPGEKNIQITFLEKGLRKTSEHQGNRRDDRPKIVFVGGSFTQGWAISDPETYPWKMQEYFPDYEILNAGTGGYGTYQSLLTLEKILPDLDNPKIVFYGFVAHHQVRNVAPVNWLAMLSSFSRRAHVFVPYATVDSKGDLVRHEPEAYISLPFSNKSALISLVDNAVMKMKDDGRIHQTRPVTKKILLQMKQLAARHKAQFVTVILNAPEGAKAYYQKFFKKNGILALDCSYPLTADMKVKGEGHPNGDWNSKVATCIKDSMYELGLTANSKRGS